jgi:hypothetical protein
MQMIINCTTAVNRRCRVSKMETLMFPQSR